MSQMINILSYTTNGGLRRLAAAVVRYLARRARPLIGPTVAGRLLFSHKKDTHLETTSVAESSTYLPYHRIYEMYHAYNNQIG